MNINKELSFEEIEEIKNFFKSEYLCYKCRYANRYNIVTKNISLYLVFNTVKLYFLWLCETCPTSKIY